MIKCYGIHWRADQVDWGRPGLGNSGTLLGSLTRSKKPTKIVDFRQQRGIYALYANYELVYVGQTGAGNQRLFLRLRGHRYDHLSERWDRFSWFGTQRATKDGKLSVDTARVSQHVKGVLDILEAVSIAISEPRLNLQRGSWRGAKAKKYFQYFPNQGSEDEDDE